MGVIALVGVRACAGSDTSTARSANGNAAHTTQVKKSTAPLGTAEHPYVPTAPSPTPSASPSRSAGPTARATSSPAPVAGPVGGTCTDAELRLTAATDARSYRVGAKPRLTMVVRNVGTRACRRDLGAAATELIITSGPAHTWSTDDCEPGGAPAITLLEPGWTRTFVVSWAGRRAMAKCAGSHPAATAGTYRLQARLGSLRSDHAVFHLT